MTAYYNEIDPEAAKTLRALIAAGEIAPGDVDERDIRDVAPSDLDAYSQCHFFAGIGIWSLALRNAGIADTERVWTGSCPCQPFSAAGARGGIADERHLWPHWHWLIAQCRPEVVFGEQVASKDGLGWLDLVSSDMEGTGYAFAAEDRCAAGYGAPHIRQRLWFVGLADSHPRQSDGQSETSGRNQRDGAQTGRIEGNGGATHDSNTVGMGHTERSVSGRRPGKALGTEASCRCVEESGDNGPVDAGGCSNRLADGDGTGLENRRVGCQQEHDEERRQETVGPSGLLCDPIRTDPHHHFWRDADWLWCRDNKFRPVEPGSFPLAHGLPRSLGKSDPGIQRLAGVAGLDAASLRRAKRYRVASLKQYGNAIAEPVARQWIRDVYDAAHRCSHD